MAGADQDAAFASDQRKDVARRDDIGGTFGRIDRGRNRSRPVERRNAGRNAFARLDRLREGGAVARGVRAHHEFEPKLVGARLRQRQADEAAAMLGHEVDGVGRRHLRRNDEVALVLAIFRVDENDHAAILHLLDDLLDRRDDGITPGGMTLVRARH